MSQVGPELAKTMDPRKSSRQSDMGSTLKDKVEQIKTERSILNRSMIMREQADNKVGELLRENKRLQQKLKQSKA